MQTMNYASISLYILFFSQIPNFNIVACLYTDEHTGFSLIWSCIKLSVYIDMRQRKILRLKSLLLSPLHWGLQKNIFIMFTLILWLG